DVYIAPVFGGRSAFAGPVGRIVQVVGNLGRPKARRIAIVDIAFHRLAQPGRAPGGVDFPTRGENDGAPHRNVWLRRRPWSLQSNDIFDRWRRIALDTLGLLVDGSEMLHETFL